MQLCTVIQSSTNQDETLDFILAASAFFESIVVIFKGEGILQLTSYKQFSVLPEYDVTQIYVDENGLTTVPKFLAPARVIDQIQINDLLQQSERIVYF